MDDEHGRVAVQQKIIIMIIIIISVQPVTTGAPGQ